MTYTEHVLWARRRAHELVDMGKPEQAVLSMLSDLSKHETTAVGVMGCHLAACSIDWDDGSDVRKWMGGTFSARLSEVRSTGLLAESEGSVAVDQRLLFL